MVRRLSIGFAAATIAAAIMVPAGAATKTVEIPGRFFQPKKVTIFVGDTVRWINRDDSKHTVTANTSARSQGESFDSSNNCPGNLLFDDCMDPGDTFSHTFRKAGTFTYRCKLHGSDTSFANCAMCGQVIVKVKAEPTTSSSPTTKPIVSNSPTTSVSPSTTVSTSPTGILTSPVPGGDGSPDRPIPILPIAGLALALLGTSGFFVWRTLIRR
jgi:plastocyanin